MSGYEELAQQPLGDNILAQIAATARDILKAQEEVKTAEDDLKTAQAHLKALQEDVMTELMSEAGQEKITTIDGLVVEIKELVRGQPTKDNSAEAFKWLRKSGNGGIIKAEVVADLGKASAEEIKKTTAALTKLGLKAKLKEGVHWQTLGALVREKLAKGEKVPLELLGVHMWKQAEVKPKG